MFDPQLGLQQLNGNRKLYSRLLGLLTQQLTHEFATLPEMLYKLAHGDLAHKIEAQQLNHTLKGVLGNLGITKLTQLSTDINLILKSGGLITTDDVKQFETSIQETLEAIQLFLQAQPVEEATTHALNQHHGFQHHLIFLAKRIESNEFIDEEDLANIKRMLPSHFNGAWQNLVDALDIFDFEQAHRVLLTMINTETGIG
jgi:HPt (histidine-containing phosphotransfer) domain-containing protein